MNCILFLHFALLLISITLLILGLTTSRWLVYVNENRNGIVNEQSNGILVICQRFHFQCNRESYLIMNNLTSDNNYVEVCFNRLYKWHNSSIDGPELLNYHKVLISMSFGCILVAVISLFLTQFMNAEKSLYQIHFSKCIADCLLMTNIFTVVLALIILTLFFAFERLQNLINYGYSFWSFVTGTCCIFFCCILIGIFRIDLDFEFYPYRHDRIVNLNENGVRFEFVNGSLNVTIQQGDLSKEMSDAIVNPTNESMTPSGGLDSIVHNAMGQLFTEQVKAVSEEMEKNACPLGQSRIFVGRNSRNRNVARFVINTVGPIYNKDEKEQSVFHLQSCYSTSLGLANAYSLTSIAYPAISCGLNKFPPDEAAQVGIESVRKYAYNVKDVRFILFERALFTTFVQEWTDFAQKLNQTVNTIEERRRPRGERRPPLSSRLSARLCTLCKEEQLPAGQEHLCIKCSDLTRSDIFDKFLQCLRDAAQKSYLELEKECKLLKPILNNYPLTYTPIKKFDHMIHKRDAVAEHYVQIYCKSFRNTMPMAIVGDGNCFYNTFIQLGGVSTTTEASAITSVELRARNAVELILRRKDYETKYKTLSEVLDHFEKYACDEMVHDTNYASIWDLLSIVTVLNINVLSVYPKVNGDEDTYYKRIHGVKFQPLTNDTASKRDTTTEDRGVRLLFSNCNKPLHFSTTKKDWTPNHFVPLLNLR